MPKEEEWQTGSAILWTCNRSDRSQGRRIKTIDLGAVHHARLDGDTPNWRRGRKIDRIKYIANMLLIIPILVSMTTGSEASWANNLGGMLSRSCMYSFGISGIKSEFDDNHGDRLWEIKCRKIGLFEGDDICMWTYDFVNEIGKKVKFSCKENQYISGLYADYNTTVKDRVWRLECCNSPGIQLFNCVDTEWVNKYGEPLDLQLQPKQVLHGVVSVFKAEERDRKWKFTVCDVRKSEKEPGRNEPNAT